MSVSQIKKNLFWVFEMNRSSRPEVFCKNGVLKNFATFTGKHLCQSLFLIKLQPNTCNFIKKRLWHRPYACNFIKKRLWHRCLPVNFEKFLGTPFFIEQLWWLLLGEIWNQVINVLHSGYFMTSLFSHIRMYHKKIDVKVMSFVSVFKSW